MPAPSRVGTALLVAGALALDAGGASARNAGLAVEGCEGCHGAARAPMVTITAEPMAPDPGTSALVTVRISRTSGNVGGFYLTANRTGAFMLVAGQQTRLVNATEVVHSSPKVATTGDVTFQMRWVAPASARGTVDLDAWGVSANGNNARTGDGSGEGRLSLTWGCPGVPAFVDRDGDGYGAEPTRVCEIGPGYAARGGDCNDNSADIHPGRPEVCNFFDDNCDGKVNEGLPVVMLYRDADGDGHGARNTTDVRMHCGPLPGYAPTSGDCDDNDKNTHPGAAEICDNKDNDCNGRVDDGARATCGVGWCRRQAPTCDAKTCVPGMPRPETCNAFDDDCDGVVDNGPDLCEPGKVCFQGTCLTREQAADAAAAVKEPPPPERAERDGGAAAFDAHHGPASAGRDEEEPGGGGGCALAGGGAGPGSLLWLALLLLLRRRR